MADHELRLLERRWRASGAPDDEARFLDARRRSGELPRGRLELAAWLGHPAARAALGEEAPAGEHVPWSSWASLLGPEGLTVLLRRAVDSAAATALTRAGSEACAHLRRVLEGEAPLAGSEPVERALEADEDELLDQGVVAEAVCLHDLRLACGAAREAQAGEAGLRTSALLRRLAGRDGSATAAALCAWALGPAHAGRELRPEGTEGAARWLRAQLQRDQLPRGRLLLAAWCGHAAAALALDGRAPEPPEGDRAWLEGVVRLDPELASRLAVGLLLPAAPLFGDVDVGTAWWAIEEAEHAAREWLAAPAHPAAQELVRATLAELRRRLSPRESALGRRALEACVLGLEAALDPRQAPAASEALLRFASRGTGVRLRRRLRAEAIRAALQPGAPPEESEP